MNKNTIIIIVLTVLVIFFGIRLFSINKPKNTIVKTISVSYVCDDSKQIDATYAEGEVIPSKTTGLPPTLTGSVGLKLSDGRNINLPQTISADGTRYANSDESIIFWSKGRGLLFMENNIQTYTGCLEVVGDTGGLPKIYESGSKGFSLRYPEGFIVLDSYKYQELGPGKDIDGVKFTIPKSVSNGTNLGSDSYLSVEKLPLAKSCSVDSFLDRNTNFQNNSGINVTDAGTDYIVASSTGAGAGNRYEETVYIVSGSSPCTAIRYFIHSSVFENYPAGSIRQFDKQSLLNQFDSIRRTLVRGQ